MPPHGLSSKSTGDPWVPFLARCSFSRDIFGYSILNGGLNVSQLSLTLLRQWFARNACDIFVMSSFMAGQFALEKT